MNDLKPGNCEEAHTQSAGNSQFRSSESTEWYHQLEQPDHAHDPVSSCASRLDQLRGSDFKHLRYFAETRLSRFGLSAEFSDDLVGKALTAVVRGLSDQRHGRRPRWQDLESPAAFLNFLRGAVASTIEAFARKAEHKYEHVACDDLARSTVPTLSAPDHEMLDLKTQLFNQLKTTAPVRLTQTIQAWEAVFLWSDRVPPCPDSYHARAVQRLAKKILLEIEPEILQVRGRSVRRFEGSFR